MRRRWGRRVIGVGGALTIAVAAVIGGNRLEETGVLLRVLDPPGAGYDSTNGVLYTGSGGAVTFTRADTWTCRDSDGTIRSLASGAPCVVDGHDGAGSLRVRSAVTNLLLHSGAIDNAAWVASASNVVTANSASCPLNPGGSTRMDLVTNTTATDSVKQTATISSSAGPFSVSAWMAAGATTTNTLFLQCAGAATASACTCTRSDGGSCTATATGTLCIGLAEGLTTTPTRTVVTATCSSAQTSVIAGINPGNRGGSAGSGCYDYTQIAVSSQPGDYCPTGASSDTCAAETATVADPGLSEDEGCACFDLTPSWTGAHPTAVRYVVGTSTGNTALIGYGSSGLVGYNAFNGTTSASAASNHVAGVRKRYCTRWSVTQNKLRVENVSSGITGETTFAGFGTFDANLYIGHQNGANQANANIDSLVLGSSFGACR